MRRKIFLLCLLLPVITFAQPNIQWRPIKEAIINYSAFMQKLPAGNKIPIVLPSRIMLINQKKVYAYFEQPDDNHYIISFDSTENCHGAKYCNQGSIQAKLAANPQVYYDMQNKELTKRILLNDARPGYFTPSHAMADYWPAMMVWRNDNILYSLSWRLPSTQRNVQETLMREMANDVM